MNAIVLAAGLGTRMKSSTAKVLHPLDGKPVLEHVVYGLRIAGFEKIILVIGKQREQVEAEFGEVPGISFAVQEKQLGTGHAVKQAAPLLKEVEGDVLVTCGDIPLILAETYKSLAEYHEREGNYLTVLTSIFESPGLYGRVIRDSSGRVTRIVEARDADADEIRIREINTGIYLFRNKEMLEELRSLSPDNDQGEYYLTDLVEKFISKGYKVGAVAGADPEEVIGINSRRDLAEASGVMNRRNLERLMDEGVTMEDPRTVRIEASVRIGMDTVIGPSCVIEGETIIGEDARIGPFTHLKDARIGDGAVISGFVRLDGETVDGGAIIPPGGMIPPGKR